MSSKFNSYISVEKSISILIKNIKISRRTELVHVYDALGRVLDHNVVSTHNVPEYDTSHMDGFAVRSTDIRKASSSEPVYLKISNFESRLGESLNYYQKKAEATRIHTGNSIPQGSDTVIPIEEITFEDENKIKITKSIKKGSFVYLTGSDVKRGKKVMDKEQVIRAQHMGLLATLHISTVSVYEKPVVSIIPTGNELTDDIQELSKNSNKQQKKIPNTNSHIISSLVKELGGIPVDLGITPDRTGALKYKIIKALKSSDLILTIGGTSAGEHDIVKSTIDKIGSPGMLANKVKLDRGRVAGIAAIGEKPILVLPGPIQGTLNAFLVFARPVISLLAGRNNAYGFNFPAILSQDWKSRKKFFNFKKIMYIKLSKIRSKNLLIAKPIIGETQSISLLSEANAFVIVPEAVHELIKGDIVQVSLLPGFSYIHDLQVID
ncbi:molybdopterin molybdotransferase MoeA [Candidatus Nitrosocosmicus hydrocola]|uniref:molybdopterin molybdotransferase MoeA n=1 Tax=Candidatus Nitrosocosmicus hydrocola TaxID=1826872 RepID=UPI0011E5D6DE|nr:molybdopterin molybdotransferase MoeA [Candidatus Nitrosocosmicus hydrocola]